MREILARALQKYTVDTYQSRLWFEYRYVFQAHHVARYLYVDMQMKSVKYSV